MPRRRAAAPSKLPKGEVDGDERNGGICEGHERGGVFEEEGGEGGVRMSFLHPETKNFTIGDGTFL